MKFDKRICKFWFILVLLLISEAKLSLLTQKNTPAELGKPGLKKNYDIVYEKDVYKDIRTSSSFKAFNNKAVESIAEIVTYRPPSDASDFEQEIYPFTAHAASEHRWGWWFWTLYHYPAINAISGRNWGHWESARNRQDDFWEGVFYHPIKINLIEINFITLPQFFQVFYKVNYHHSQYIPVADEYKVGEFIDQVTGRRINADLLPRTYVIAFHKPIFAQSIKIVLKKPFFANYFAIEKVKFFQRRSYILIKNSILDYCNNYCFFVNTDVPRVNFPIEAYPCIEMLNLGDNREIYVHYNDRSLRYSNKQDLCVGFNGAKEIVLKHCNNYEPSFSMDINNDGTVYFEGYNDRCIYIDGSKTYSDNFITDKTEIKVTSEGDLQMYKKENMLIPGDNFWSSTPGEKRVTLQIIFGHIKSKTEDFYENKKVDVIKIEWKYVPKKFKVFTWKKGGIWILKKQYFEYKEKMTEINLVGEQMSGIMLVLEEGHLHKELGDKVAYSIVNMYAGTKSYKLKNDNCKNIEYKYKAFDFDQQSFRKIDQTKDYHDNRNKLDNNFAVLRRKYLIMMKDKMFIPQSELKANHMRKILAEELKKMREQILKKIKEFKFINLQKVKNTEFMHILQKKNWYKQMFPTPGEGKKIGTYDFPALDCLSIKNINNESLSGWYYIKTECSSKAVRVFCDFSILDGAVDFFIFNDDNDRPNPNINYLEIKTVRDMRFHCAKHGLFPIKMQSHKMMVRLQQILQMMNYDLSMQNMIPLGYDYGCDSNLCSGRYKSLDDRNSVTINSFFNKATRGTITTSGKFAGLGGSGGFMTKFEISGTSIGGLVCSTNHFQKDLTDDFFKKISCSTSVASNGNLFPINGKIIVSCPMDCDIFPGEVYGKDEYHSNSSVCKAAIHAGLMTKTGGKIRVNVSPSKSKYKGNKRNNIKSVDYYIEDGLPSFSFEKFKPLCPIDPFLNDPNYILSEDEQENSSFISVKENYSSYEEFIPNIKKLAEKAKNEANNQMKKGMSAIGGLASNALNEAKNMKEKVGNYLTEKADEVEGKVEEGENQIQDAANNMLNAFPNSPDDPKAQGLQGVQKNLNPNNVLGTAEEKEKKRMEEEKNKMTVKCEPNTDLGKTILRQRREQADWEYFKDLKIKLVQGKEGISKFNSLMSWSVKSSKYSNYRLNSLYMFVEKFRMKLLKIIQHVKALSKGRLFRTKRILRMIEDEYIHLHAQENWHLDYKDKELFIEELEIHDFYNGEKKKSNWAITTVNLKNRSQAVANTNKIRKRSQVGASFISVRKRNYYDFELNVDVMISSPGVFGVAFRFLDPFNYYALKIDRFNGRKYIIKVIDGYEKVIQRLDDGGILIDSWHTLKVTSQANMFKMFFYSSENPTSGNEKMFEFSDSDLSNGTIAFFVNNVEAFYFDNMLIKGRECWSPWRPPFENTLEVISNTANAYTEYFKGNFNDIYEVEDPADPREGPSFWELISKESDDKEISIYQGSKINDSGPIRFPSMAILKRKYLTNGIYRVEFTPSDDNGIISIIFKYSKQKLETGNLLGFYTFDLINAGDDSGSGFVLRRIENGLAKEIKAVNDLKDLDNPPLGFRLGYITHVPNLVQIEVNEAIIKISISINSKPIMKIMQVEDLGIIYGEVGIGTYNVKAMFTALSLRPLNPNLTGGQTEDFIKNGTSEIMTLPYKLSTDEDNNNDNNNNNGGGFGNGRMGGDGSGNNNKAVWRNCVKLQSSEERKLYCQNKFKNDYQKAQCEVNILFKKSNFCDRCCKKSIFWKHKNTLHTCIKQCNRNTSESQLNDSAERECINSQDPDRNVYIYCSNTFHHKQDVVTCKYDMCNLCCVNLSTLKQRKYNFQSIQLCFKGCSKSKNCLN